MQSIKSVLVVGNEAEGKSSLAGAPVIGSLSEVTVETREKLSAKSLAFKWKRGSSAGNVPTGNVYLSVDSTVSTNAYRFRIIFEDFPGFLFIAEFFNAFSFKVALFSFLEQGVCSALPQQDLGGTFF